MRRLVIFGGLGILAACSADRLLTPTRPGRTGTSSLLEGDTTPPPPAPTTTTITGDTPDPSVMGAVVTVSFTVTADSGSPDGTVTITDPLGGTCSGDAPSGSCTYTPTSAGLRTITASYAGNTSFAPSSGTAQHTVKGRTTTTITAHAPDPSETGTPVTVRFTVAANEGSPAGKVTVSDPLGGSCSGTAPSGSCSYTPTRPGVRTITARYVGSASFATSKGTAEHTVNDPSSGQSVTLVGAGDVHAKCVSTNKGYTTAALVSDVLAADPEALAFTIGDNAGIDGTTADFACYHKSWGAFKSRTKLVMGNHERRIDGAAKAYYDYGNGVGVDSGAVGRRGKGYYAFTHGSWRILVLNSEQAQSEQPAWIKADIAAHPTKCQLALFHKFLFTSGSTVNPVAIVRPFWQALYAKGVDVILNAHDHTYQRYAKMRWDGVPDPLGIREFISGTGGGIAGSLRATPLATNEKMLVAFGVLKLKLFAERYEWQFIDIAGTVRDSGGDTCH